MGKRQARILVSTKLFFSALAFPEGVKLLEATTGDLGHSLQAIELLIEHHELPEVEGRPPVITPTLTQAGPRPAEYLAFDWNLPEERLEAEDD